MDFLRNTQNLKKSSLWFDKSTDLPSKRQNHEDFFSNYVWFSKSLNFNKKNWSTDFNVKVMLKISKRFGLVLT